jgi:META domain.
MQYLKIFILLFVVCACRKDGASDVQSLYHSWEAKSFMSVESVAYPKTEGKRVLLTFNPSGNVGLKLEANGCGSSFVISKPGQIKMDPFLCTLICCDSQFSDKLLQMLPQVTSYEIVKNKLRLNVPQWGYIEFELEE